MVRKLAVCLLLFLLLLGAAQADVPMVRDDANLFSEAEIASLENWITQFRKNYQMDAAVWTTYAIPRASDSTIASYADDYYEQGGMGLGSERSGILFLIDMTNRYNYISTGGDLIPYINDDRRESILNAADEYLPQQRWGSAILAEMKRVERYVRDGIEEGTFLFDTETGQRISGLYNRLTKGEGLLALLAGILTAVVTGSITIGRYGLKGSTYKHKGTEALDLSRDEEQHVRTTSRRVPITDGGGGHGGGHSGGGGGHSTSVHHSSSGTMHGGGGHHF